MKSLKFELLVLCALAAVAAAADPDPPVKLLMKHKDQCTYQMKSGTVLTFRCPANALVLPKAVPVASAPAK